MNSLIPKLIINDAQINLKEMFKNKNEYKSLNKNTKKILNKELKQPKLEEYNSIVGEIIPKNEGVKIMKRTKPPILAPFTDASYNQTNANPVKEVVILDNNSEIIIEDIEDVNTQKPIAKTNNELIELTLYKQGIDFQISPKMLEILKRTEELTIQATQLIKNTTPENVNEEQLEFLQKEMTDVRKYDQAIKNTLTEISKTFDAAKKSQLDMIKELLNESRYDEMQDLISQLQNIKKYVANQRYINNWNEITEYYLEYLSNFPHLKEKLPNLVNPEMLKQKYPKLSNRSKSWKLTNKIKSQINEYVAKIEENYQIIKMQNSPFEDELFNHYNSNENITETLEYNMQKIQQKQRDEELKRKLEEEARLRKEKEKELEKLKQERELQQRKLEEERQKQLQIQKEQAALEQAAKLLEESKNKENKLPFGISQEDITPEKYQEILLMFNTTDIKTLTSNQKLLIVKTIINKMYDPNENKEILEYLKTPDDALKFINWITK